MQKTLAIATLAAVLTLAACARDAEPAVEPAPAATAATPPATATPAPIPGTDAIAAIEQPDPATDTDTAFDSKAFAGNFAAQGTRLEIQADGIYRLTDRAGSAGADLSSPGTWTLEPDGRHILLDPESKAEADRRYEIVSNDELRATDGSGQSLRRE